MVAKIILVCKFSLATTWFNFASPSQQANCKYKVMVRKVKEIN
jgi:hypothetical protein